MIYNLSPLLNILTPEIPNRKVWEEKIVSFFENKDYDPALQDWYYDTLVSYNLHVKNFIKNGYLIDPYTGLFTFDTPQLRGSHSFNMAHFISSNYQHFYQKRILTLSHDYGMMNIQLKMCGLNLVSAVQKEYLEIGSALACIGNNCPPYTINNFDVEEDVILLSCVFQEEALAYKNWEFMLDKRLDGKEVFFTSNTFNHLRQFINYDRIEPLIDPQEVYKEEDYADMTYGYMNKIYRLK